MEGLREPEVGLSVCALTMINLHYMPWLWNHSSTCFHDGKRSALLRVAVGKHSESEAVDQSLQRLEVVQGGLTTFCVYKVPEGRGNMPAIVQTS